MRRGHGGRGRSRSASARGLGVKHKGMASAPCLARRLRFAPDLVAVLEGSTHALVCDVTYFVVVSAERGGRTVQRVILVCDPACALEYGEHGCFRADPWLRYGSSHSAPVNAADVLCLNSDKATTVQLAAKFGFRHVTLIPAPVRQPALLMRRPRVDQPAEGRVDRRVRPTFIDRRNVPALIAQDPRMER